MPDGERSQRFAVTGYRRVVAGLGRQFVLQAARSNQPPAVSHGSGVYETGRGRNALPWPGENHLPGIRLSLT
jgi:hypothetical protein